MLLADPLTARKGPFDTTHVNWRILSESTYFESLQHMEMLLVLIFLSRFGVRISMTSKGLVIGNKVTV